MLTCVTLRDFLTEHFFANRVHQQTRCNLAVGRVFFHQYARRQNSRLVELFNGHAVIQITYCLMQDRISIRELLQSDAGRGNHGLELVHVERDALTIDHDLDRRLTGWRRLARLLLRTLFHALGAVKHIGARNIMFTRTHQRELDLILHIFNVESAACWLTTHQG